MQVRLRGTAAATNFALSDYRADLAEYHKMQQVGRCRHDAWWVAAATMHT